MTHLEPFADAIAQRQWMLLESLCYPLNFESMLICTGAEDYLLSLPLRGQVVHLEGRSASVTPLMPSSEYIGDDI